MTKLKKPRPHVVNQPHTHRQLLQGVKQIADLLAPTLGPLGGAVGMAANDNRKIELLDDAGTMVRRIISLGNQHDDIGAMLIRSMVWQLEQRIGDGGAMAAVLARSLITEGVRFIAAGANAMMLADGVRSALNGVLDAIRSQARPVCDENALAAVALTAMGEPDLAAMTAELRWLLGPEGHVTIERFVAPYLERRYISGVQFKAEIASMYFYTEPSKRRTVLANPVLAISEDSVNTVEEALPIMEAALQRGAKALLIVAKSFGGAGLNLLASNNQLPADKKKLDLLACRTTLIGAERTWTLRDLALLSGATILGASYPRSSSFVRPEDLGVAHRAEFVKDLLIVAASGVNRAAVQEEAAQLQTRAAQLGYDAEERKLLTRRISTLTGGVAELKIGANSQPQRELLNAKAERGLKVVAAAQRSGVVAGAGAALIHASRAIDHTGATGDRALGVELLKRTLTAPLRQIAVNAGVDSPEGMVQRVRDAEAPATFDAFSHNVVDANQAGILDAAELVATVLQTAVSAGLMALTTDAIVYHRKPMQSLEP